MIPKIMGFLLALILAGSCSAKEIDGSKNPELVPDKVALRLFLKSIALILDDPRPEVRASVDGIFEMYHFEKDDATAFKLAAIGILAADKDKESRSKATDAALQALGEKKAFKDALKNIKRGIKLDSSEIQ